MPALRPIVRDPLERPSRADRETVRTRAAGIPIAQAATPTNPLGQMLAGTVARGSVRLKGGKFNPRATSGML